MRVFISWSKPASRVLASALRDWLPDVIQQVKPWMSQEDVPKGERWLAEIATQLDEVNHGIACVTRENAAEPWLNFEAGALAKSLESSRLWTLLLDLPPTDVTGPLTTFQATSVSDEDDMLRFIKSLNDACEQPLEDSRLKKAFDRTWPEFAAKMAAIELPVDPGATSARSETDMVAETLERVRAIERAVSRLPHHRSAEPHPGRRRVPLQAHEIVSPDEVRVGMKVLHPTFGLGEVKETKGRGQAAEALVGFDAYGNKRLVLAYAPLSIVEEALPQLPFGEAADDTDSDPD